MSTRTVLSIDELRAEAESLKFVVLVYFRGSWCPWCEAYARDLERVRAQVEEAGGRAYIVSSQSKAGLEPVAEGWAFGGSVVSDASNGLANKLGVSVTVPPHDFPGEYPNNMAQPAFVVLRAGAATLGEAEPVYGWFSRPDDANLDGGKGRVHPEDGWRVAKARLEGGAGDAQAVRYINGAHVHEHHGDLFARLWSYYSANEPKAAEVLRGEIEAAGRKIEAAE